MNSNSSKKYKIVFSLSFLIVVIIMILFFNFGLTFNNDAEQNGTNKEVISNEVESKKDNDENYEKINGMKVLSLEEGLDLLYSNEKNDNVDIKQTSIDEHVRRIRNVKIIGFYNYMDARSMYLDGVEASGEVYDDVEIMIEGDSRDENADYSKLKKGNKVEIICTIMKPYKESEEDENGKSKRAFRVYNATFSDDEVNKKIVHLYTDENPEDNIDKKYEDKDKIFEFEDIYDDMVTISNENLERAMNLFDGVKFRVRAKADKCFTVYDAPYLKYTIDNDDTSISTNSEVKYISGQINFIGELRDTKESMYYITKDYFSIELEKVIDFDSSDFKYQYKDYRKEVSYLYADKEIKKGYQDFIYKFNVDYTYDINLIRLDENLEPYDFTKDIPDVFDDKLKKIGEDKDIGIGDNVKFGKKRYKVIAVDEEDENKVLLMYDTHITDQLGIIHEIPDNSKLSKINWSDNEECIYRDSKIREYLTKDFYENNFSNTDKARIYTTKLECKVKNAKKVNEIDYVEDKIFILSDDEIKKYKLFLVNPLLTSFVRNQRYGEKSASMYRRSKILNDEHDQNTFNLKDTWSIYPAMWVNIK